MYEHCNVTEIISHKDNCVFYKKKKNVKKCPTEFPCLK